MNPRDVINTLPDLVVVVRRDGVLLGVAGGSEVEALRPAADSLGQRLDSVWPEPVAALVGRLVLRAIASRETLEAEFNHQDCGYEARVTAQGPDRAICVIRLSLNALAEDRRSKPESSGVPHFDRRGFLRRLRDSISMASLNERPFAVAIIHVDGLLDISRLIDAKVSDQVSGIALRRLPAQHGGPTAAEPSWYIGQFGESLLIVVVESASRELIDSCVSRICDSLREPIQLGDATFQLTPSAGVAILGRDAGSPKTLVEHARATAIEARRAGSERVFFFSDTLKLRSLARLDIARELREAITNRDIRLRYVGRHDLATGELSARVGYLQWVHPLRGEIRPAEFVGIAETTGLSAALSRSLLETFREDFATFRSRLAPTERVSFGALRHHVLSDRFLDDIKTVLATGEVPAERLELRIAERSYIARDVSMWRRLADLGVHLVVDEFGRMVSSLDLLARVPLWGLQLDRSWGASLQRDPAALKVCRAVISVATAMGVTSIATGVDDERRRQILLGLGCQQGLGDLYKIPSNELTATPSAKAQRHS